MTQLYNQITKLKKHFNCLLDHKPTNINSIYFWFDNYSEVVPNQYIPDQQNKKQEYRIVYITDNKKMHKKYDKSGVYHIYYKNEYVKINYFIYYKKQCDELIGKYILDWDFNKKLKKYVKSTNSQIIYLNYF